ncbi:hypothetical protein DL346_09320 [Paenibacillus montanisoli]|uniref:HTH araC/xylS-type domain-containing protein n=1 Tax=Paenibacillus montanisoli TaxID=2081970 RepID=A0A328TZ29_9BACL|nr:hypothetical protein DL346_09320 [Paenibacillus montanisoli]
MADSAGGVRLSVSFVFVQIVQAGDRGKLDRLYHRNPRAEGKGAAAPEQLKIHKIGRAVGFESAAYFARCFKKMTGHTPQEFRDGVRKL